MPDDQVLRLREELDLLKAKFERQGKEFEDVMRYSDMAIVETKGDMRIINTFGATDFVFEGGIKYLERGESLLKVIMKATKNSRVKPDDFAGKFSDNPDADYTIDAVVSKFVEGTLNDKEFKIVGEKDNNELFLLIWKIRRCERSFLSYFKIIPTNAIINAVNERNDNLIENTRKMMNNALNMVSDGVIFLDLTNKINYINSSAKKYILSNPTNLFLNANFEGRYFQELFATEHSDEVRFRLDINKDVLINKEPKSYSKKIADAEILNMVIPTYNERNNLDGLMIVMRNITKQEQTKTIKIENKSLIDVIRTKSEESLILSEKVAMLERNLSDMKQRHSEDIHSIKLLHGSVKRFYAVLDSLPFAIALLSTDAFVHEYANSMYFNVTGLTKDRVIGFPDTAVFPGEAGDELQALNRALVAGGSALGGGSKKNIHPGTLHATQTLISPAGGEPTHILRILESINLENDHDE